MSDCSESATCSLESLPDELVSLILSFVPNPDLKAIALSSRWLYAHATDWLWRKVVLQDTFTLHVNAATEHIYGDRGQGECDEHDDTPIIRKLFILASNPLLASKVKVLTHRCHLPTPGIFSELICMHFDSPHLSSNPRLLCLLRLALQNLENVHTLHIVCGHRNITTALLEGFFKPSRPRSVRRLWLESSSILGARIDFGAIAHGLESIRLRRLRVETAPGLKLDQLRFPEYRAARWGRPFCIHDNAGGFQWVRVELGKPDDHLHMRRMMLPFPEVNEKVQGFEEYIWDNMPEIAEYVDERLESWQMEQKRHTGAHRRPTNPSIPMIDLFKSSLTITRLNLDWVMWRRWNHDDNELGLDVLHALSRARFPKLRVFQVRNAVVHMTSLPPGIFLLSGPFLDFMEAHPNIQCLAFPLDRFDSHRVEPIDISSRSRKVVQNLARSLVELRLDSYFGDRGDPVTDTEVNSHERIRRRRFIEDIAPHMTKIETIKLEGGIPRDEKREILRALHFCPLKKIVMIGASFPCGNTWGHRGRQLRMLDQAIPDDQYEELEDEDEAVSPADSNTPITTPSFSFEPSYGWPKSPPFLQTIAAHHASTVEELKLCGFNGSPVLSNFHNLRLTRPILYPLAHFHNLRQLILSFWLLTNFEDSYRDAEIIQSWKDTRSPTSTALVIVPPTINLSSTRSPPPVAPTMAPGTPNPASRPQEFNRWAVALKTQYTPSALAYRVASDIGPFLSPEAKARPGGVRIRASFCLGTREEQRTGQAMNANDIFDLDVTIGEEGQVLEFVGPREEGEEGRWWGKLDGRRWF